MHVGNGSYNVKGTQNLASLLARSGETGGRERMGRCGLFICPIVADWPSNPWRGVLARVVWSGEEFLLWLIGLQIHPLTHLHSAKTVLAHIYVNEQVVLRCTELSSAVVN